MPYAKVTWVDGSAPNISATNLNNIENTIDSERTFPTATGTGTAILVTAYHFSLTAGVALTFVASANNSGSATTLNVNSLGAKSVYKPGGTAAPTIISGKAYTVWYNGTNFFVKAAAEGTAVAARVLTGYTFSNDSDTGISGSMPNRAGNVNAVSSHRDGTSIHVIPAQGYTDGSDDASVITDADFVTGNIKSGANIFGLDGKTEVVDTSSGTAVAANIRKDYKAWSDGVEYTGTNEGGYEGSSVSAGETMIKRASKWVYEVLSTDYMTMGVFNDVEVAGVYRIHWIVFEMDPLDAPTITVAIYDGASLKTEITYADESKVQEDTYDITIDAGHDIIVKAKVSSMTSYNRGVAAIYASILWDNGFDNS